ncbi:hypothetical protein [Paraburkholderia sp.]|jgi:hypothetical protein|uniref:hypothetical protein n=1 Tax=Paraburkholderia sp. TaxID=1926495 RepID=UPI002F40C2EE
MQTLRRAALPDVALDHAKLVSRCHLSHDTHVILFCLVLVQNTSHRDIQSRQSKEIAMHTLIFIFALATAGRLTRTSRGARYSPITEAL